MEPSELHSSGNSYTALSESGKHKRLSDVTDDEKHAEKGYPVNPKVLKLSFATLREGNPNNEGSKPSSPLKKISRWSLRDLTGWKKNSIQRASCETLNISESPPPTLLESRPVRRKSSERDLIKLPSIPKDLLKEGSRFMRAFQSTLESHAPDLNPITKEVIKEVIWDNIRDEHIPTLLTKLNSRNPDSRNNIMKLQSPRVDHIFNMIQNDRGEFKFKHNILQYFSVMEAHFDSFPCVKKNDKKWLDFFAQQLKEITEMIKQPLEEVLKSIFCHMARFRKQENELIYMAFGGMSQFEELVDNLRHINLRPLIRKMTDQSKELACEQNSVVKSSYYSLPAQTVTLPINEMEVDCRKYVESIRRFFYPNKDDHIEELVINGGEPIVIENCDTEKEYYKFIAAKLFEKGWDCNSIEDEDQIEKRAEEEAENILDAKISSLTPLLHACTVNEDQLAMILFKTLYPSINQYHPYDEGEVKEMKRSGSWRIRGGGKSKKTEKRSLSEQILNQQYFGNANSEPLDCRDYRYSHQSKQLKINIREGRKFEIVKYPSVKLCPLPGGQESYTVGKLYAIIKRKSLLKGEVSVSERENDDKLVALRSTKSDQIMQIEFSEHTGFKKRREIIKRMIDDVHFRNGNENLGELKKQSSHEIKSLARKRYSYSEPQEAEEPAQKEKKGVAARLGNRLKRKRSKDKEKFKAKT